MRLTSILTALALFLFSVFLIGCGGGSGEGEDTLAPVTTASPPGGTFTATQSVTLACNDGTGSGCAATHYTLDDSKPTTASSVFAAAISISRDTTLKFFSVDAAGNQEAVRTESYLIDIVVPDTTSPTTTASPEGGTYTAAQLVTLTCDDGAGSGCAATHYTVDGSNPTLGSPTYSIPIAVAATTQLRFFSVDVAGNREPVRSEAYVINVAQDTIPPATTAAPPGGTYTAALSVTLTCDDGAGSGCAATRYTTDGTVPTASATLYTAPIAIGADNQLRFFSVDNAGNAESVRSEAYVINVAQDTIPPVTTAAPPGGTHTAAQLVTLTCDDGAGSGCATSRFTVDGTVPDLSSPVYVAPIVVTTSTTLRFFSVDVAGNQEPARTEVYVIDVQVNTAPVANAGPDQVVVAGVLVQLDGTGSSDVDGDTLTYGWAMPTVPAGSAAVLDDSTSATPTFTADVAGEYRLLLAVNDGQADSALDEVIITAASIPQVISVSPPSSSPLGLTNTVTVTFDRSMNPASLAPGGNMGAATAVWSSVAFPNDRVELTPASSWTNGWSQSLTVDAQSAAGAQLATLALSFDVLNANALTYLFVDGAFGSDSDNGLFPEEPKATIKAAVDAAPTPSAVLVAGGTYSVNSDPGVATQITLGEGISIYGGYRSEWPNDFQVRDGSLTEIVDTSTATLVNNSAVVAPFGGGIGRDTVVNGLTIRAGGGTSCAAVRIDGQSPVLRNNTILGGSNCDYSYGVHAFNGSSPWIAGNTIRGGIGTQQSAAVYAEHSQMVLERSDIDGGNGGTWSFGVMSTAANQDTVRDNVVHAGTGGTFSFGIHVDGIVQVSNNTVDGGAGPSYSIALGYTQGEVVIENNILFTRGGNTRLCIWEDSGAGNPAALHNNDLFDCPGALYVDFVPGGGNCPFWGSGNCLVDVASVNALSDMSIGSSGNVSVDPAFSDPSSDWHLTPASPVDVREGGLDLSAFFSFDKDRTGRTVPWSMGAYEQD